MSSQEAPAAHTVSAHARRGLAQHVSKARETAHQIAQAVDEFSERLAKLRALAHPEGEEPGSAPRESLLRRVSLQDSELTLALEELRAQNDCLLEAHALLEEQRIRYLDLFDNAPDAYVTTDATGILREANLAAASLFGLPKDAVPGKLLIAFVARRDTRAFRRILNEPQSATTRTFSLRLRARGGSPFQASLSVRAVRRSAANAVELRWTIRPTASMDPAAPPIATEEGEI